jgi:hypothetical protein
MGHFSRAFLERLLQEFDESVTAGASRPTVEDAGRFLCRVLERNSQAAPLVADEPDEEVS